MIIMMSVGWLTLPSPLRAQPKALRGSREAESGTVEWPGEADRAPETLYERIRSGCLARPRTSPPEAVAHYGSGPTDLATGEGEPYGLRR